MPKLSLDDILIGAVLSVGLGLVVTAGLVALTVWR